MQQSTATLGPDFNPLAPEEAGLDPRRTPVLSALEAFRILGVNRTTGYKAIREGTFPVPVLHIGRMIRVPTAALAKLLSGNQTDPPKSETA
jgi:predicted DNA-binding transcriptional regulator AlpA